MKRSCWELTASAGEHFSLRTRALTMTDPDAGRASRVTAGYCVGTGVGKRAPPGGRTRPRPMSDVLAQCVRLWPPELAQTLSNKLDAVRLA
jgi:hypothetical protein